jgi:hypothetical protein
VTTQASISGAASSSSSSSSSSYTYNKDLSFWRFHCWACKVELRTPKKTTDSNEVLICYALHEHPLLKVPCCCVCAKEMADQEDDDDAPNDSVCCSCGRQEEHLEKVFLCDSCPRAMCDTCVTQAHQDATVADEITSSNAEWQCCHCQPPNPLQALQEFLVSLKEDSTPERTVDELLTELEVVETKKKECMEQLEGEQMTKEEIRQELELEHEFSKSELEEQVEEEFDAWKVKLEQHELRLSDTISTLHDELEALGYNLKEFYQRAMTIPAADVLQEPSWKKAADKAIAEREQQQDQEPPPRNPLHEIDVPEDVEELESLSDESKDTENFRAQWRNARSRARPDEIQRALGTDGHFLASLQITVSKKITEQQDRDAMVQEDGQRARARVRSDHGVALQQRRAYTREQAQRKHTTNTKSASAPMKPSASVHWCSSNRAKKDILLEADIFDNSSLVLSSGTQREIAVAEPLAKLLKPHQKEGIRFMFWNVFGDFVDGSQPEVNGAVGGCILAHNMGLGKSRKRFLISQ